MGHARPELIEDYVLDFLKMLHSTNNRLVWSGMIALSIIADRKSEEIFQHLSDIKQATERGSVITADNGIKILAKVASVREDYNMKVFPLLIDHLEICRSKDLPQRFSSRLPFLSLILVVNTEARAFNYFVCKKRHLPSYMPPSWLTF